MKTINIILLNTTFFIRLIVRTFFLILQKMFQILFKQLFKENFRQFGALGNIFTNNNKTTNQEKIQNEIKSNDFFCGGGGSHIIICIYLFIC